MTRDSFFASVRDSLFKGSLAQHQVDGMNAILDANDSHKYCAPDELAYVLATPYHETEFTMQPVEEIGKGRGHIYGLPDPVTGKVYYGRGFVQLTWKQNYDRAGRAIGVDLLNHPEQALVLGNAAHILFCGMVEGWFTGKRLCDYIREDDIDYLHARRIINGLDRADDIAKYAKAFRVALN